MLLWLIVVLWQVTCRRRFFGEAWQPTRLLKWLVTSVRQAEGRKATTTRDLQSASASGGQPQGPGGVKWSRSWFVLGRRKSWISHRIGIGQFLVDWTWESSQVHQMANNNSKPNFNKTTLYIPHIIWKHHLEHDLLKLIDIFPLPYGFFWSFFAHSTGLRRDGEDVKGAAGRELQPIW